VKSISQTDSIKIVIRNDDVTPVDFVNQLLKTVFAKSLLEAEGLTALIGKHGSGELGPYPSAIANAMVLEAQSHIDNSGYPLKLGAVVQRDESPTVCAFCGMPKHGSAEIFEGRNVLICSSCLVDGIGKVKASTAVKTFRYAHEAITWFFVGVPKDELVATTRQFPGHMRPDVQSALDAIFTASTVRFFGLHEQFRYETLTFSSLTAEGSHACTIAPAQFQDVDIGTEQAARCLNNGLWLCEEGDLRFAVVLSFHREFGRESGTCVEIVVPAGEAGASFATRCFERFETAVRQARSYRGKVLSLETENDYRGRSAGVTVHRLPAVSRDEVILPEPALKLLDRNVIGFVKARQKLRKLGQSTRKGLLLYGPPGTGKTHTVRYLASSLPGHTTLLITADQVAQLGQYMSLARLLQPALVVIEDADLIGRSRTDMNSPCEEALLNKLLNEMDGLREDCDILFILTTNRPEELEFALAGRPGRIDQAIEVPLPDAIGREKLIRLYGRGLSVEPSVVADAVKRTEGVSAAFVKEMMRRACQAGIERNADNRIDLTDISDALNDMLFTGGKLNLKLLGASQI
jgi:AAA+ superfamily predicted ATPase/ATP-dependent Clp protease adapter protein ClpS